MAARAGECSRHGFSVAVADNSGTYEGAGVAVATGGNVGFGAGCNRAAAALPPSTEALVLLNPDVSIDLEAVDAMAHLVVSGEWDLLAPLTLTRSGARAGFTMPALWRELGLSVREWARSHRSPAGGSHATSTEQQLTRLSVGSCPRNTFGSAAMIVVRRSAFERVGGFDETYFLYVEDADLWDRLVADGARAGFVDGIVMTHDAASGSRASTARRVALRRLGIEHFLALRGRQWRPARWIHRALLPAASGGDAVIAAIADGYRRHRTPGQIQSAVRVAAIEESVPRP